MSLPSTSNNTSQSSIRSFFRSQQAPKYAPPPSSHPKSSLTTTTPPPPPTSTSSPPATTTNSTSTTTLLPSRSTANTPTLHPLSSSLPPQATIRPFQPQDIQPLKRINSLLLPVAYPPSFYTRALEGPFSRAILWCHDDDNNNNNDSINRTGSLEPKVVGGVVCRLEPELPPSSSPSTPATTATLAEPRTLYIRSLCLLSPYRGHGLVNAAVDHIVAEAAAAAPDLNITAVTAHVWTENEDGLRWYENRGFRRLGGPIAGYYYKLRPDTAFLVSRDINSGASSSSVSAAAAGSAQSQTNIPLGATAAVVNLPPQEQSTPNGVDAAQAGEPPAIRRPPMPTSSGQSYQKQGPGMEWNDLPEDMARGVKSARNGTESASGASSRSSSAARKKRDKRDRAYPAAAFGS